MTASLGYDVRLWRQFMGWTQFYTAQVFMVDDRTVRRWESGAIRVPWRTAQIMERLAQERAITLSQAREK